MDEETLVFAGIVVAFAILLGLDWRFGLKSLRVGTAILALATLYFFQPSYHTAWRRAISAPPSELITQRPTSFSDSIGPPLSDYESGVSSMYQAVRDVKRTYARERWLVLGVLFWLACSPVFRRAHALAPERRTSVDLGDRTPQH
jgi:hypothetical protein